MRRVLHSLMERSVHAQYRRRYACPDHVWLASYPRSGNTWLRRMLYDALVACDDDTRPMRETIPDLHQRLRRLGTMRGPFVKTHYPWRSEYRRAVYVVRDPVASLRSYARYTNASSMERFVQREHAGRGIYGSWADHVRSFLDSGLGEDDLLVVRYEDMRRDSAECLQRILAFGGEDVDPSKVQAVAAKHDRPDKVDEPVPPSLAEQVLTPEVRAVAERLGYTP